MAPPNRKEFSLYVSAPGAKEATSEVKAFAKATEEGTEKATKAAKKAADSLGGDLSKSLDNLKGSLAAFATVVGAKAFFDFGAQGAQVADLRANLDLLGLSVAGLRNVGDFSDTALGNAALLAQRLGREVGTSADQTNELLKASVALADAYGRDLNSAVQTVFNGVAGSVKGLRSEFGLFLDSKTVLSDYARQLGTTTEKLDEYQQRAAFAAAIQRNLNSAVAQAPIDTMASKFDKVTNSVTNLIDELKELAANKFFGPLFEAITGKYASDNVSSGNIFADRLAQGRNRLAELRRQANEGDFENRPGISSVFSQTPDVQATQAEIKDLEKGLAAVEKMAQVEAGRLRTEREESERTAKEDAANASIVANIEEERIKRRKDATEAAKQAGKKASDEELKRTEEVDTYLWNAKLEKAKAFYKQVTDFGAQLLKTEQERFNLQASAVDARIANRKSVKQFNEERFGLAKEAFDTGRKEAGRHGSGAFAGAFAQTAQSEEVSSRPDFQRASTEGVFTEAEAESARLRGVRDAIYENIITPMEIASSTLESFAVGMSEAAASAIIEGKGFKALTNEVLRGLAKQALAKSIFHTAAALASLAVLDFRGAALHGQAAATFGAVAAVAAVGAAATGGVRSPSSGGGAGSSTGGGGGRGVPEANTGTSGGAGATYVQYNTISYNGLRNDPADRQFVIDLLNQGAGRPGSARVDRRSVG